MAGIPIQIDPRTGQIIYMPQGTGVPQPAGQGMGMYQAPAPMPNLPPVPTGMPPAMPGLQAPAGAALNMPNSFWPVPAPYAEGVPQQPQMQALGPEAGTRVPPGKPKPQAVPVPVKKKAPEQPSRIPQQPLPPAAAPTSPPPIGASATAQVPPPPTDPALLNEATNNWETFLGQLSNPGFYNMLLSMGMQLLQPMPIGQTAAGHVGTAMQGTMQNQLALLQNKLAREAATRKETREETALGFEGKKVEQGEREVGIKESAQRTAETVAQAEIMGGVEERKIKREGLGIERSKLGLQEKLNEAEIKAKEASAAYDNARAESERKYPGATGTRSAKVQWSEHMVPAFVAAGMTEAQAKRKIAELDAGVKGDAEFEAEVVKELTKQALPNELNEENLPDFESKARNVARIAIRMKKEARLAEYGVTEAHIQAGMKASGQSRDAVVDHIAAQKGI